MSERIAKQRRHIRIRQRDTHTERESVRSQTSRGPWESKGANQTLGIYGNQRALFKMVLAHEGQAV